MVYKVAFSVICVALLQSYCSADVVHRYSFTNDATDSVGNSDGVLVNGATISGGAAVLDGIDDYVDLSIGATLASLDSATIEGWVTWSTFQSRWSRVFDFGSDTTSYMFLTPRSGNSPSDIMRFAETVSGNGGEFRINSGSALPVASETHFAVTIDSAADEARLYVDGTLIALNSSFSLTPSSLGNTTNNYLGRSQFSADPFFHGSYNEFRIYDSAFSASQVGASFDAGPDVLAVPEPGAGILILATAIGVCKWRQRSTS